MSTPSSGIHRSHALHYWDQPRDDRGRFARLCPDCEGRGLMNALAACRSCEGRGHIEAKSGRSADVSDHDCSMAPTYATVDVTTYCGHPSHDGPPYPDYSEYWDADICGNCGIPVDRHGDKCGEWADAVLR